MRGLTYFMIVGITIANKYAQYYGHQFCVWQVNTVHGPKYRVDIYIGIEHDLVYVTLPR